MTTYANICSVHIIHLLQGTHFPKRFAKAVPRPESLQSRCFEDSKQLNSHRKGRSAASLAIAKSVKIENCDHMPPYAIIWCHMSPFRFNYDDLLTCTRLGSQITKDEKQQQLMLGKHTVTRNTTAKSATTCTANKQVETRSQVCVSPLELGMKCLSISTLVFAL